MPQLDLMDEVFIVAAPPTVATVVADRARWRQWWPDLDLTVQEDRGVAGIRWLVAGSWTGSMEVWVQPHLDGAIAHYYLRLDPAGGRMSARRLARSRQAWGRRSKRLLWALKDELEAGRPVGERLAGTGELARPVRPAAE